MYVIDCVLELREGYRRGSEKKRLININLGVTDRGCPKQLSRMLTLSSCEILINIHMSVEYSTMASKQ